MQLLIGLILLPVLAQAGLKHHSEDLQIMDIESIQRIVARNLGSKQNTSRVAMSGTADTMSTDERGALIQESFELVLARPEQNSSTSAVFTNIENAASGLGGAIRFLNSIADEGLRTLDKSGKDKNLLKAQNTYIHILNNMMSEIKPRVVDKDVKYKKLAEKVRDADISFSDALKSHRLLHSMKQITNPSKLAETIAGKKDRPWWKFW